MKNKRLFINIVIIVFILVSAFYIIAIRKIANKKEKIAYEGIKVEKQGNPNNVDWIQSLDNIQVPVPKGYKPSTVESERYVNGKYENGVKQYGGFVIYEGNIEVNANNLEEEQKTRNQWVWVPIDTTAEWTDDGKILTGTDEDSTYLAQYMHGITQEEFLAETEQTYYEMKKSVDTYGGFYVGRYETTDLTLKKSVPSVKRYILQEYDGYDSIPTWYDMYQKCRRLSGMNTNVETNMIWGIQWDDMLNWIIETGEKKDEEVNVDSTKWGNYKNSSFYYKDQDGTIKEKLETKYEEIPAGSADYTKANNIYDLAGNEAEFTMESDAFFRRYYRSGDYFSNGNEEPANYSYSHYYPYNSTNFNIGCRAMLYIK